MLSVLTEVERYQSLINMKEWQCGIFQISDGHGEPISDPVPYALFLNNLTMCSGWAITGEYNKDGIFHTHALLKTGSRTDSVRRAMKVVWDNLMCSSEFRKVVNGSSATIDCLKLQRCQKPSSMFGYMMKAPMWCMSSDERNLQFMYDLDKWELNKRFKQDKGEPDMSPDMNVMTKEIIDLVISNGCRTFEDCLRHGSNIMSKYLHRPGLTAIVNNCLQFVKSTGQNWSLALFEAYDPDPAAIHKVLLHQDIKPADFDEAFHKWLTKGDSKKNTLCIQGPSNTGKSAFISGLKQIIPWGEIVNGQTFMFEGLVEQTIGVWEEPLCSAEAAEKTKQILEGMTTSIPIKYKKPFLLPRTPIIITTNHNLWRFCTAEENAFLNRMWIFYFHHPVQNISYNPRTSEPRCECSYCRASVGRALGTGESSACGVPTKEQSVPAGEQLRAEPATDVRTGSMLGAGEGTSRSSSSQSSSTDQQCTNISKHGGTTSSSVSEHMGQFRIISTRDSERGFTRTGIHVESRQYRSGDGRYHSETGRSDRIRERDRGDGNIRRKHDSSITMGSNTDETDQISVPTKAKRSRVGKKLGTKKITIPMQVPTADDWREYLSYLYHWYG